MSRGITLGIVMALLTATCVVASPPVFPGDPVPPTPTTQQGGNSVVADAERLLSMGDIYRAQMLFEKVLKEYPGSEAAGKAISGIANSFVMQRNYQGAVGYLENVIVRSPDASTGQKAREVYSKLAATVDGAQRQAYQVYRQAQAQYDSISWFNIFRIFEKFRLRSDLKQVQKDLDEITEVKLLFNPVYLVSITGPGSGSPAPSTGATNGNASTTPGATHEPPPGNGNLAFANTNASPGSGNQNTSGANPGGAGTTTTAANANTNAPVADNTNKTVSEPLATEVVRRAEEKAKALKVLEDEMTRILELIPPDKRDQARKIIVTGGGFVPLSNAQPATATSATPSGEATAATTPVPSPSPSAEPAAPTTTTPTVVASPAPAVDPTPVTSATPSPAPGGSASPSQPASTNAAVDTGEPLETLQRNMVAAYRTFQEAMRSGDRLRVSQAQNDYMAAMQAYRARQATLLKAVQPTANRTPPGFPGAPGPQATPGPVASPAGPTAPTASPASTPPPTLVPPTVPVGGATLVPPVVPVTGSGPAQPTGGSTASTGSGKVGVNPAAAPGGRPMNDQYLRSTRGGLQGR
ncbi:MAG: hypothetical protein HY815_29285 [Candidatus Riflebacteria bacterium]|nr:hypothetical protein [Candidatus Riflebacteria bacterium]